jgi:hypothetical protein
MLSLITVPHHLWRGTASGAQRALALALDGVRQIWFRMPLWVCPQMQVPGHCNAGMLVPLAVLANGTGENRRTDPRQHGMANWQKYNYYGLGFVEHLGFFEHSGMALSPS